MGNRNDEAEVKSKTCFGKKVDKQNQKDTQVFSAKKIIVGKGDY